MGEEVLWQRENVVEVEFVPKCRLLGLGLEVGAPGFDQVMQLDSADGGFL